MKKALLILLLATGCGTNPQLPQPARPDANNNIDPSAEAYVEAFVTDTHVPVYNQIIEIVSQSTVPNSTDYLAECFMTSPQRDIKLFVEMWSTLTPKSQKTVIYHELGHCVLNRVHRQDYIDFWCPASIMYPIMLDDLCAARYKPTYINELTSGNVVPSLSDSLSNLPEFTVTNAN